ncbi:RsbRD N-terminal domain-containing protein, partial [Singulisphaera rosea]
MSDPAMLADHLDQQSDAILAVWRSTVERVGDVSEAERLSEAEFNDHIPDLLDRLADRLRGRLADAEIIGKKHGQVRWRQGYDIAEIVN